MLPDVDTRDSAVQPNLDTVLRSRLAGFDLSRDATPSAQGMSISASKIQYAPQSTIDFVHDVGRYVADAIRQVCLVECDERRDIDN